MIPVRRCPVPWCRRDAHRGHALCLPCWRLVSVPVQAQAERAFRLWSRDEISDEQYLEVLWLAIRSARETRRTSRTLEPRRGGWWKAAARVGR